MKRTSSNISKTELRKVIETLQEARLPILSTTVLPDGTINIYSVRLEDKPYDPIQEWRLNKNANKN